MDHIVDLGKGILLKPFLASFFISLIATPVVIKIANYWGLVDDPKKRKHPAHTEERIVPRAGGLAIFLGIAVAVGIFLPFSKQLAGIMMGSLIVVVVGILDDKFDLDPYFRLVTNIVAALIVVGSGIGISYITNPFGGIIYFDYYRITFNLFGSHSIVFLADLLAILWIVWCMNMVNWSKGVDGQMPGFVGISAIVLGLLSFRFTMIDLQQWIVATLAFITAGAYLGFLPFNFYPQKIMPGYGGGALAGFMLSVLAIASGGKVATALLVLGIPFLDAGYTILRRLLQKRSPFWGDRGHLHHKLLDLGWGKRRIALFYWLLSVILGLIALNLTSRAKIFVIIFMALALGGILLWLSLLLPSLRREDQDSG
jgi:UDP-GlcNAc:undecaprenyl-phosphate GlcNAc-1-phosphate transferase